MKKKILIVMSIILIALFAYGIYYVNDYAHADSVAKEYLNVNGSVKVSESSNGLFIDGKGNDTALIFYPGAKIEYISYLPLLCQLANDGVDCYLVEMPFNLAFLDPDSANEIIDTTNYSHYFLAGHSLGGVSAASYVNSSDKCDGLILLASYPTQEIYKPALSVYGSEDKILNMEKYNEAKPLLKNLTEIIVPGGNHAQFGNYGNQTGAGIANISSKAQQKQCDLKIIEFINNITL